MNLRKRIVALCLVTAAALSLVFAAPAKRVKQADNGQASLLCESYEEHEYKLCESYEEHEYKLCESYEESEYKRC